MPNTHAPWLLYKIWSCAACSFGNWTLRLHISHIMDWLSHCHLVIYLSNDWKQCQNEQKSSSHFNSMFLYSFSLILNQVRYTVSSWTLYFAWRWEPSLFQQTSYPRSSDLLQMCQLTPGKHKIIPSMFCHRIKTTTMYIMCCYCPAWYAIRDIWLIVEHGPLISLWCHFVG